MFTHLYHRFFPYVIVAAIIMAMAGHNFGQLPPLGIW